MSKTHQITSNNYYVYLCLLYYALFIKEKKNQIFKFYTEL